MHIGVFQIATYLHQTLFLHTAGNWIIGVSGVLLFSNICLGLYQAWPRTGQWLRALSAAGSARLAAVELPVSDSPWFAVRLTQSHDVRRYFGTTNVYISNRNGGVLGNYAANAMPASVRMWDALYAVHTGEIGGTAGRCLVALVGVSLLVLIGLGLWLYFVGRSHSGKAAGRRQDTPVSSPTSR